MEAGALYSASTTSIEEPANEASITFTKYYTLDGVSHDTPQQGINIVRTQYTDGCVIVEKMIVTQD